MKRLEGNGCKISYVVIEKFVSLHCQERGTSLLNQQLSFFKSTNLQWTPFSKTARLYNCDETGITVVPHKHTKILGLKGVRYLLLSPQIRNLLCQSSNI